MDIDNNSNREDKQYLTSTEAARELFVSAETLRRYEEKGLIKSERTSGGHRRFLREDVDIFKKSSSKTSAPKQSISEEDLYFLIKEKQIEALLSVLDSAQITYHRTNFQTLKEVADFEIAGSGKNRVGQYSEYLAVPLTTDKSDKIIGFLLVEDSLSPKVFFMRNIGHEDNLKESYISVDIKKKTFKQITDRQSFLDSIEQTLKSAENETLIEAGVVSLLLIGLMAYPLSIMARLGHEFIIGLAIFGVAMIALIHIIAIKGNNLKDVQVDSSFEVSAVVFPIERTGLYYALEKISRRLER